MNRALLTFLVPLLAGMGGWASTAAAQTPANPDPTHQPMPGPTAPATARPIEPQAAGSGITSDLSAGDQAPDFALRDESGRWVRLADLKGEWTAIVFTGNLRKLAPLKSIESQLHELGVRLFGVSPDGAGALLRFRAQQEISFGLLSDPTEEVSQLFGMFDPEQEAIAPGIVVLDPKGLVRSVQTRGSVEPDAVLSLIRKVVPEVTALAP